MIFLIYIVPVFMLLCMYGPFNFSEVCTMQITGNLGSTEYNYYNAKGEECGHILDSPYSGTFAYAYPTQWWNFTELRGKDYASLSEAIAAIQRICKIGAPHE